MKVRPKRKKRIDIAESGALSDLAFLLIVFFIVIAVFNINKGLLLQLPKSDSTKIVNVNEIIKIQLNEKGQILEDSALIGIQDLEEMVKANLAVYPNMTFLLHIHPDAIYQDVVDIINLVRQLKVENFSFSMKEDGW